MNHELPLLLNLTIALALAFVGGVVARRVGLPTLVGYLAAGIVIGPFTPGFVGDQTTLSQFAELGVIFLLFGVGLHFSLRDLWAVRRVAIPGALVKMAIVTFLGFVLARWWGWSVPAGLVLGASVSIASTVVVLRGLADTGLLNTDAGRVSIGWLVLEDLATVLLLVLLPVLAPDQLGAAHEAEWLTVGLALLKTLGFAAIMLVVGVRVMPWMLLRVAHTGSRELFIVAVVVLTLGTALGAAELFGVSLALGAFLAGVVISESELSHQVGTEVLPFRETFAVLFFVSVGMLVDPRAVAQNPWWLVGLVALIVLGKIVVTLALGLVLPASARTMLVVALGQSQIGEFSFLLGQAGVQLGLLASGQYALLLAAAVVSILVNPFMLRARVPAEAWLRRGLPAAWRRLDRTGPEPPARVDTQVWGGHVVVIGHGRVGSHIVRALEATEYPVLVVEADVGRTTDLRRQGIAALYGDAADSDVLMHAGLDQARALVVTVPDEAGAEVIVAAAHDRAPDLPIVARAATRAGTLRLRELGAGDVILPEFEGGLALAQHTLLRLGLDDAAARDVVDATRERALPKTAAHDRDPILQLAEEVADGDVG